MNDSHDPSQPDIPTHRAAAGPDDVDEPVRVRQPMPGVIRYSRTIQAAVFASIGLLVLVLVLTLHHHAPSTSVLTAPIASFTSPQPEQTAPEQAADEGIPTPHAASPTAPNPALAQNLASSAARMDADLCQYAHHCTTANTQDNTAPSPNNAGATATFSPPSLAPGIVPQQVPEPGVVATPTPHLGQTGFYIGQDNRGQNGTSDATPSPASDVATTQPERTPVALPSNPYTLSESQRIAWANGDSEQPPYLTSTEIPPASQYEVWAGSGIPCELDTGINADLPGPIVAHVITNVYDSRTQHTLLIPLGTRVIGRYNSQITVGQARIQVAWDQLIFPDGRTFDLGGAPGATTEGNAGLYADVNTHIGTVITTTIIMGLLNAGQLLTQNGQTVEINPVTGQEEGLQPGTAALQGLAGSTSNTGQTLVQQKLNQPPELTVPKGERFLIIPAKTLLLQPYLPDRIQP